MSAFLQAIAQLHFLRPWWLLALLLLPLLAWWRHARPRHRGAWQEAVDPHLLPHLLEGAGHARRRDRAGLAALLAAALAILALAGPSLRKLDLPAWQASAPLVVVIDLSSAARARDLPPSRLAQARAKIAALLRSRTGGQVALVAFADDAYTVAPLTADAANVALFLDALAPEVMPADGRRVDRAIAWSQRLLRNAGYSRGDILLLTDGADPRALAEATRARAAGYRVSVIGVGTVRGGSYDGGGGPVQVRLDPASLQALASAGGGGYRALAVGDADLRALGLLDPREVGGAEAGGAKVEAWRDDGYWLLPLAMLLALPLFRRGTVLVLLLALWWPMGPASAQQGSLWRRADQQAHARMQEGVAAYRQGRYDEAIGLFSGLDSADAQYNLGNALAQAGRYDEAIAAYDRALALQPGMRDAIDNRAIVEQARSRKPPPQDAGADKQGQQPQPGPGQEGPGQPSSDAREDGRQDATSPSSKQSQQAHRQQQGAPKQSTQPSAATDPQRQREADAEQRRRMQEALRRQQGKDIPGQAPARQESPEQRERRLANQAQLQRIPDDPGALLRAKFVLEHERRRREGGR